VPRPVASSAYSFLRFTGGAVGPYVALKLGEEVDLHAPFVFGAVAVALGALVLAVGHRGVTGRTEHAEVGSEAEAQAVLVGDA
jgi:hypothetical protein